MAGEDPPELGYRGRGRPRLPEGERRRDKLVVSLNEEEMRAVMHAAADCPGGPMRIQDWVRRVMLEAARAVAKAGPVAPGGDAPG